MKMKKLSELSSDTMLCIDDGDNYDSTVMSKEDLLQDYRYLDKKDFKTSIGIPDHQTFEWEEVFENKADNMYEEWQDHIERDLSESDWVILNKAKDIINKVFRENPAYSTGEKVEVDM
jgi:hypothetical protein